MRRPARRSPRPGQAAPGRTRITGPTPPRALGVGHSGRYGAGDNTFGQERSSKRAGWEISESERSRPCRLLKRRSTWCVPVNSLQFWPHPAESLREIRRLLGGRSCTLGRTLVPLALEREFAAAADRDCRRAPCGPARSSCRASRPWLDCAAPRPATRGALVLKQLTRSTASQVFEFQLRAARGQRSHVTQPLPFTVARAVPAPIYQRGQHPCGPARVYGHSRVAHCMVVSTAKSPQLQSPRIASGVEDLWDLNDP